ncbi:MAG: hypothetical protein EOO03_13040 [Chitinophagaceae bacterium]|nr:MAG: hypothetical protein EOO03_13040 [Chitinophagaceae bacterium]
MTRLVRLSIELAERRDPNFELTVQLKTFLYSICRRLWLKKLQYQQKYVTPVESLQETVPVEEEIEQKE